MTGASVDGLQEQTHREATPHSELTNDSCRTHTQSHAATVPPSNGATCRSSASQKAQTVYLASYNTTFREKIYIRWCCIDLLRPPPNYAKRLLRRAERLQRMARDRRQPFVQRGGITERGSLGGTWPEGQVCCSAWPFVQGIMQPSKLRGVMKRPGLWQTAVGTPDSRER